MVKQIEKKHKSSFVGIASTLVSTITILAVAIYYYNNIPDTENLAHDEHYAVALEIFAAFVGTFLIFLIGGLLGLSLAVISLVRKERKLFPLITISLTAVSLIAFALFLVID